MKDSEDRIKRLVWALNRVQAHGLAHYEDCKNAEYDDQDCTCGMEMTAKDVRMALEQEIEYRVGEIERGSK